MDLHRLRVVDFDTLVSEKEGEKDNIAELEVLKEEECNDISSDKKDETNELGSDTKCVRDSVIQSGSSEKSTFIKHKSKSEIFRIPSKNKLKKRELKINSSLEDLPKPIKDNAHLKQKKRTLNLFNRKSIVNPREGEIKNNKSRKKNEEVNFLFARETPSFIKYSRKRNKNEGSKKSHDTKLYKDIFGFQKNNQAVDPYLYQMSCNYLNIDKFKKIKKGLKRKLKKSPHSNAEKDFFCKHHAMRVLHSGVTSYGDYSESPSIYYNLDSHCQPRRMRRRRDYTDYEDRSWDQGRTSRPCYMTKDEILSVSPSSLVPIRKCCCDACVGASKPDASRPHRPPPCSYRDATSSQSKPQCPRRLKPRPQHSTPSPSCASNAPGQNKLRPIPCKKKQSDIKKFGSIMNSERSRLFSGLFQTITAFHSTKKKPLGRNCIKYAFFGLLIIVWSPCLLAVILAWVVMCPVRLTSVLANEKSRKSLPFFNSFMNRFRKKGPGSEYQRMRCDHCSRQKHTNFMTSVASWYARAAGTVVNSFTAMIDMLKIKNKSPCAGTCAGSSFLTSTHPNPKKRYTLFYADNRGWMMKPVRRSNTQSCCSNRIVQSMRCEFKPKFWQKSKSDQKDKTMDKGIRTIGPSCRSMTYECPCPVHGFRHFYNNNKTRKASPAGDASIPGCVCTNVLSQYSGKMISPQGPIVRKNRRCSAMFTPIIPYRPTQQVNIPMRITYPVSGIASYSSKYQTVKSASKKFNSNKIANINQKDFVKLLQSQQKSGILPYGIVLDCPYGTKHPVITNKEMFRTHKFGLAGKTLNMSSTPRYKVHVSRQTSKKYGIAQGPSTKNRIALNCPCGTEQEASVLNKKSPATNKIDFRKKRYKSKASQSSSTKNRIALNCPCGTEHEAPVVSKKIPATQRIDLTKKRYKSKASQGPSSKNRLALNCPCGTKHQPSSTNNISRNTLKTHFPKDKKQKINKQKPLRTRNKKIFADLSQSAITKQVGTSTFKIKSASKSQSMSKHRLIRKLTNLTDKTQGTLKHGISKKVDSSVGSSSDHRIALNCPCGTTDPPPEYPHTKMFTNCSCGSSKQLSSTIIHPKSQPNKVFTDFKCGPSTQSSKAKIHPTVPPTKIYTDSVCGPSKQSSKIKIQPNAPSPKIVTDCACGPSKQSSKIKIQSNAPPTKIVTDCACGPSKQLNKIMIQPTASSPKNVTDCACGPSNQSSKVKIQPKAPLPKIVTDCACGPSKQSSKIKIQPKASPPKILADCACGPSTQSSKVKIQPKTPPPKIVDCACGPSKQSSKIKIQPETPPPKIVDCACGPSKQSSKVKIQPKAPPPKIVTDCACGPSKQSSKVKIQPKAPPPKNVTDCACGPSNQPSSTKPKHSSKQQTDAAKKQSPRIEKASKCACTNTIHEVNCPCKTTTDIHHKIGLEPSVKKQTKTSQKQSSRVEKASQYAQKHEPNTTDKEIVRLKQSASNKKSVECGCGPEKQLNARSIPPSKNQDAVQKSSAQRATECGCINTPSTKSYQNTVAKRPLKKQADVFKKQSTKIEKASQCACATDIIDIRCPCEVHHSSIAQVKTFGTQYLIKYNPIHRKTVLLNQSVPYNQCCTESCTEAERQPKSITLENPSKYAPERKPIDASTVPEPSVSYKKATNCSCETETQQKRISREAVHALDNKLESDQVSKKLKRNINESQDQSTKFGIALNCHCGNHQQSTVDRDTSYTNQSERDALRKLSVKVNTSDTQIGASIRYGIALNCPCGTKQQSRTFDPETIHTKTSKSEKESLKQQNVKVNTSDSQAGQSLKYGIALNCPCGTKQQSSTLDRETMFTKAHTLKKDSFKERSVKVNTQDSQTEQTLKYGIALNCPCGGMHQPTGEILDTHATESAQYPQKSKTQSIGIASDCACDLYQPIATNKKRLSTYKTDLAEHPPTIQIQPLIFGIAADCPCQMHEAIATTKQSLDDNKTGVPDYSPTRIKPSLIPQKPAASEVASDYHPTTTDNKRVSHRTGLFSKIPPIKQTPQFRTPFDRASQTYQPTRTDITGLPEYSPSHLIKPTQYGIASDCACQGYQPTAADKKSQDGQKTASHLIKPSQTQSHISTSAAIGIASDCTCQTYQPIATDEKSIYSHKTDLTEHPARHHNESLQTQLPTVDTASDYRSSAINKIGVVERPPRKHTKSSQMPSQTLRKQSSLFRHLRKTELKKHRLCQTKSSQMPSHTSQTQSSTRTPHCRSKKPDKIRLAERPHSKKYMKSSQTPSHISQRYICHPRKTESKKHPLCHVKASQVPSQTSQKQSSIRLFSDYRSSKTLKKCPQTCKATLTKHPLSNQVTQTKSLLFQKGSKKCCNHKSSIASYRKKAIDCICRTKKHHSLNHQINSSKKKKIPFETSSRCSCKISTKQSSLVSGMHECTRSVEKTRPPSPCMGQPAIESVNKTQSKFYKWSNNVPTLKYQSSRTSCLHSHCSCANKKLQIPSSIKLFSKRSRKTVLVDKVKPKLSNQGTRTSTCQSLVIPCGCRCLHNDSHVPTDTILPRDDISLSTISRYPKTRVPMNCLVSAECSCSVNEPSPTQLPCSDNKILLNDKASKISKASRLMMKIHSKLFQRKLSKQPKIAEPIPMDSSPCKCTCSDDNINLQRNSMQANQLPESNLQHSIRQQSKTSQRLPPLPPSHSKCTCSVSKTSSSQFASDKAPVSPRKSILVDRSQGSLTRRSQISKKSYHPSFRIYSSSSMCNCPFHNIKQHHELKPSLVDKSCSCLFGRSINRQSKTSQGSSFHSYLKPMKCRCFVNNTSSLQIRSNKTNNKKQPYVRKSPLVDKSCSCLSGRSINRQSKTSQGSSLHSHLKPMRCRCLVDNRSSLQIRSNKSSRHSRESVVGKFNPEFSRQTKTRSQHSSVVMSMIPIQCDCSSDETTSTQNDETSDHSLNTGFDTQSRKIPSKRLSNQHHKRSQFSSHLRRSEQKPSIQKVLSDFQQSPRKTEQHADLQRVSEQNLISPQNPSPLNNNDLNSIKSVQKRGLTSDQISHVPHKSTLENHTHYKLLQDTHSQDSKISKRSSYLHGPQSKPLSEKLRLIADKISQYSRKSTQERQQSKVSQPLAEKDSIITLGKETETNLAHYPLNQQPETSKKSRGFDFQRTATQAGTERLPSDPQSPFLRKGTIGTEKSPSFSQQLPSREPENLKYSSELRSSQLNHPMDKHQLSSQPESQLQRKTTIESDRQPRSSQKLLNQEPDIQKRSSLFRRSHPKRLTDKLRKLSDIISQQPDNADQEKISQQKLSHYPSLPKPSQGEISKRPIPLGPFIPIPILPGSCACAEKRRLQSQYSHKSTLDHNSKYYDKQIHQPELSENSPRTLRSFQPTSSIEEQRISSQPVSHQHTTTIGPEEPPHLNSQPMQSAAKQRLFSEPKSQGSPKGSLGTDPLAKFPHHLSSPYPEFSRHSPQLNSQPPSMPSVEKHQHPDSVWHFPRKTGTEGQFNGSQQTPSAEKQRLPSKPMSQLQRKTTLESEGQTEITQHLPSQQLTVSKRSSLFRHSQPKRLSETLENMSNIISQQSRQTQQEKTIQQKLPRHYSDQQHEDFPNPIPIIPGKCTCDENRRLQSEYSRKTTLDNKLGKNIDLQNYQPEISEHSPRLHSFQPSPSVEKQRLLSEPISHHLRKVTLEAKASGTPQNYESQLPEYHKYSSQLSSQQTPQSVPKQRLSNAVSQNPRRTTLGTDPISEHSPRFSSSPRYSAEKQRLLTQPVSPPNTTLGSERPTAFREHFPGQVPESSQYSPEYSSQPASSSAEKERLLSDPISQYPRSTTSDTERQYEYPQHVSSHPPQIPQSSTPLHNFQPTRIIPGECTCLINQQRNPPEIVSDHLQKTASKSKLEFGLLDHRPKQSLDTSQIAPSSQLLQQPHIISSMCPVHTTSTMKIHPHKLSNYSYKVGHSENLYRGLSQCVTIQRSEVSQDQPSSFGLKGMTAVYPTTCACSNKEPKKPHVKNKSDTLHKLASVDKPPPGLLQRHSSAQVHHVPTPKYSVRKGSVDSGVRQQQQQQQQQAQPAIPQPQQPPYPDFNRVTMRYPGQISGPKRSEPIPAVKRSEIIPATSRSEHIPHPANYYYQPAVGVSPPPNYARYPCYINPANTCGPRSGYDEAALRRAYKRRPLRYTPPKEQKLPETEPKHKKRRKKVVVKKKSKRTGSKFSQCCQCVRDLVTEAENEAWPNGVSCSPMYIHALKRRPCFWIYQCCPSMYPAFLNCYKFQENICQMLMYLLSICFWCPLIFCIYFCCDLICRSG